MATGRLIVLRDDGPPLTRAPLSFGAFGAVPEAAGLPRKVSLDVVVADKGSVAALRSDPQVRAFAEPMTTALAEPVSTELVAAPPAGVEWGVTAVGALGSSRTGAGITVAVLDTGIDASHPAFAGIEIVAKDFTGTRPDAGDGHGHGTHCAGVICGRDVGGVRVGVAPGVSRLLVGKVLPDVGGGDTEAMIAGLQWAIQEGAHVVSMSVGFDFPGMLDRLLQSGQPPRAAANQALRAYRSTLHLFDELVQWAVARGVTIIAAAGNESDRATGVELDVAPPAAAEGVVSVGAVGRSPNGLVLAGFSNTGVRVVAPGVDVLSAAPGGGWARMSGTSMATPHVAGVAALWAEELKATFGRVSPSVLVSRLEGKASTAPLVPGIDPADVGTGLVVSPP